MAGQITSAGPLTTLFTPASSCFNTIGIPGKFRFPGAESSAACFPSSMNLFAFDATPKAYFSPGRCPVSYTPYTNTILGHVITIAPTATGVSVAEPTEYIYDCCPSPLLPDFVSTDQGCLSYFSSSTVLTWSQYDLNIGTIGPAQTTTLTDGFPTSFFGYEVQVRFQDSDISALGFQSSDLEAYGLSGGAGSYSPASAKPTQNSPLSTSINSATPTQTSLATTAVIGPSDQQAKPSIISATPFTSTSTASFTSDSNGANGGLSPSTTIILATVLPVVTLLVTIIFGINQWKKREKKHQHPSQTTPRNPMQATPRQRISNPFT